MVQHWKGEFYIAKEIDQIGTKVGIVQQAIKEVLQSLVDNDLVKTDRKSVV